MEINNLLEQFKQLKFLRISTMYALWWMNEHDPDNPLGYEFARKTCKCVDEMNKLKKQICEDYLIGVFSYEVI